MRVRLECTLCHKWFGPSNHKKNSDTTSEPPLNGAKTSATDFLLPALSRPGREKFPSESLSHVLCPGSCTRLIKFKWDGIRRSRFIQRSTLYLKCSDNRHSILVVYSPVIIWLVLARSERRLGDVYYSLNNLNIKERQELGKKVQKARQSTWIEGSRGKCAKSFLVSGASLAPQTSGE